MHSKTPDFGHHVTLLVKPTGQPSFLLHGEHTRLVVAVQLTSVYETPSTHGSAGEHAAQLDWPLALAYVPGRQSVHDVLPLTADDLLPVGQSSQVGEPASAAYLPAPKTRSQTLSHAN